MLAADNANCKLQIALLTLNVSAVADNALKSKVGNLLVSEWHSD